MKGVIMGRIGSWILFFLSVHAIQAHESLPATIHYGPFVRSTPDSATDLPWTRIMFYVDGLFTLENVEGPGRDFLGHGTYEIDGDTLSLKSIHSSLYSEYMPWQVDNLEIPEIRYVMRAHARHTFEILRFSPKYPKPSKWSKLERPRDCPVPGK